MNTCPTLPVTKPKSLMVFGILDIVLGAYSVVTSIPGVFLMLNPEKYASNPVIQVMQNDQVYATFQKAMIIPGLLGVFALLVSGIGLVKAREWGRKLAILWSWYMIVVMPLTTWMLAVHVHPAMFKQIMEQAGRQAGNQSGTATATAAANDVMVVMTKVTTVVIVVLYVAYCILQIVMLSRGKVKAFCRMSTMPVSSPSAP